MKVVAEVPVRMGSKRVPKKNLRLICGKPMVGYALEACKQATMIDEIYINSEADELKRLAEDYGVDFYRRKVSLAEDSVRQDDFNYDFLCNVDCDVLVMVNPVSPLVLPEDIDDVITYYIEGGYDSVISVKEQQLQAFYCDKPLNLDINDKLPMTQDLNPVQMCCWTVCVWNAKKLRDHYAEKGFGVFVGKVGLYPFDHIRSLKVSTETDFRIAEVVMEARGRPPVIAEYY